MRILKIILKEKSDTLKYLHDKNIHQIKTLNESVRTISSLKLLGQLESPEQTKKAPEMPEISAELTQRIHDLYLFYRANVEEWKKALGRG